jgi:hypothetical protein
MSRGVPEVGEEEGESNGRKKSVSAPVTQEEPERELTHEEFDPKGTLALILMYFAILVLMWVFMYFIEFLGNDLVVVG